MDKRIIRTKKLLRRSLLDLVSRESFDKITVTKICLNAGTGRGTFYTYYSDKNVLLLDCFNEMREITKSRFEQLQLQNNPDNDLMIGLQNLIESIFLSSGRNSGKHNMLVANGEIQTQYYRYVVDMIDFFAGLYQDKVSTRYDKDKLYAFLALGIWGFINIHDDADEQETRQATCELLKDLVESNIFIRKG